MELGVFLLQLPQAGKGGLGVRAVSQLHPVIQHRLQKGSGPVLFKAQAIAGRGVEKPCDRRHRSGGSLLHGLEFGPGIDAELVSLFPVLREDGFHP